MKRFTIALLCVFSFLFVFNLPLNEDSSFADTNQIIINTSYTFLYKDSSFNTHYDFKIMSNEILACQGYTDNYYEVVYNYNETDFHGYIKAEFASIYTPFQEVTLVYNGKIINRTNVFKLNSLESLDDIVLDINHEIFLYEGFDSKKDYTNIKFSYNGQVYVGRILTKDLSPYGINKALIISLSVISALVGAILILLGINKKKWHKSLKMKKK